jgi:hypothetical protein
VVRIGGGPLHLRFEVRSHSASHLCHTVSLSWPRNNRLELPRTWNNIELRCSCPDDGSRDEHGRRLYCKHICFVLVRLLGITRPWQVFQGAATTLPFLCAPRLPWMRNHADPCCICQEGSIGQDYCALILCHRCLNGFHFQCLAAWRIAQPFGQLSRLQLSCPFCRSPISLPNTPVQHVPSSSSPPLPPQSATLPSFRAPLADVTHNYV